MDNTVAFEYKNTLEEGVILHIIQDKKEGAERYKIDLTFDAFKDLLWISSNALDRHRDKIINK